MSMAKAFEGMPYIDDDTDLTVSSQGNNGSVPCALSDDDPDLALSAFELRPRRRGRLKIWPTIRLTDELVRAAHVSDKDTFAQDSDCPYLWLRVRPTGGKSFYFKFPWPRRRNSADEDMWSYAWKENQTQARRECLGSTAEYTVAEARELAEFALQVRWEKPRPRLRHDMPVELAVAAYLKERPGGSSEWHTTVANFFRKVLIPRFGACTLSGVRKEQWIALIRVNSRSSKEPGPKFAEGDEGVSIVGG